MIVLTMIISLITVSVVGFLIFDVTGTICSMTSPAAKTVNATISMANTVTSFPAVMSAVILILIILGFYTSKNAFSGGGS